MWPAPSARSNARTLTARPEARVVTRIRSAEPAREQIALAAPPQAVPRQLVALDLQNALLAALRTAHHDARSSRKCDSGKAVVVVEAHDDHAAAAWHFAHLVEREDQQLARSTTAPRHGRGPVRAAPARAAPRPASSVMNALPALHARDHVVERGDEAVAAAARDQELLLGRADDRLRHPGARLQLDQRGDRHAVAAAARNVGRADRVGPALRIEQDDRMRWCASR